LGLLLLIAFLVWLPSEVKAPKNLPFQELEGTLILLQGNSLVRSHSGALQNDLERQLWEVADKYPELERIIFCESSGRENVCSYKGCNAGMGLLQIIPSSLKLCENKFNERLNPFDAENNIKCGLYLLELQGLKAWESSRHCWEKDIDKDFFLRYYK